MAVLGEAVRLAEKKGFTQRAAQLLRRSEPDPPGSSSLSRGGGGGGAAAGLRGPSVPALCLWRIKTLINELRDYMEGRRLASELLARLGSEEDRSGRPHPLKPRALQCLAVAQLLEASVTADATCQKNLLGSAVALLEEAHAGRRQCYSILFHLALAYALSAQIDAARTAAALSLTLGPGYGGVWALAALLHSSHGSEHLGLSLVDEGLQAHEGSLLLGWVKAAIIGRLCADSSLPGEGDIFRSEEFRLPSAMEVVMSHAHPNDHTTTVHNNNNNDNNNTSNNNNYMRSGPGGGGVGGVNTPSAAVTAAAPVGSPEADPIGFLQAVSSFPPQISSSSSSTTYYAPQLGATGCSGTEPPAVPTGRALQAIGLLRDLLRRLQQLREGQQVSAAPPLAPDAPFDGAAFSSLTRFESRVGGKRFAATLGFAGGGFPLPGEGADIRSLFLDDNYREDAVLISLAQSYADAGMFAEADGAVDEMSSLAAVLRRTGRVTWAFQSRVEYVRAYVAAKRGRVDAAEEVARQALLASPFDPQLLLLRARLLLIQGRYDLALSSAVRVVALDPFDAHAAAVMKRCKESLGMPVDGDYSDATLLVLREFRPALPFTVIPIYLL
eukprot:GHVU01052142.1.p1 GENE.GHVU01052142.1~~GHVU01052142.1.p1  ORF type:complete len:633 (+),score=128.59 GHVU01052142.1:68-1900(+)